MSDTIRIEGIEPLLAKIKSLAELKPVAGAVTAAALHVKGQAAIYPEVKRLTRASVYGSTFKSDKQRRYFFAALRKGEIEVPYRRGESPKSETFGRRWTIATSNAGLTAEIGNNASYGPRLMDSGRQSLYAKAVCWRTVEDVLDAETETVTRLITYEIQRAIEQSPGHP
jgi:hypothetical protein